MFKIGDFSRFTRVSVKMLRHYDDLGLLKPSHVDPETSYRYYSADQLPRLNRIIALKDLGFSLEQIARLLEDDLPGEEIRGMLRLRLVEIEQQLQSERARLAQVEARLRHIEQERQRPLYDVVVRQVAPQAVAAIRETVSDTAITRMFEEVEAYVAKYRARAFGSPLTIYHDSEYREDTLDVEVAVPITEAIPATPRVTVREMPGCPTMACVVYTGAYDKSAEVLNELLVWIQANNFVTAGPIREVYLRFGADRPEELNLPAAFLTDDQQLYVTELQLPLSK